MNERPTLDSRGETNEYVRDAKRYDQNPLISCIPTILENPDALLKELEYIDVELPTAAQRSRSKEWRLREISALQRFHIPFQRDVKLALQIGDMLREGLVSRAPHPKYWANHKADLERFVHAVRTGATAITTDCIHALIGIPGVGKSTTVERALAALEIQTVVHARDDQPLLPIKQVLWIRVECPPNRQPGSIAGRIVEAIWAATGTTEKLNVKNNDDAIMLAASLSREHVLGLIVIDEIQRAVAGSRVPRKELINTIVSLSNTLHVPILLVGTPKADRVLQGEVASSRRTLGPRWLNFSRDDPEWDMFVERIWMYQWTNQFAGLDGELKATIYDLTQGIPAFFLRLFEFAQRFAVIEGRDRLTPDLLRQVFDDLFVPVKRLVAALKIGDPLLLEEFEDMPKDFVREQMLKRETRLREEGTQAAFERTHKEAVQDGQRAIKRNVARKRKEFLRKLENDSK